MYELNLVFFHGGDLPEWAIWILTVSFFVLLMLPTGLLFLLINYLGNKAEAIKVKEKVSSKELP